MFTEEAGIMDVLSSKKLCCISLIFAVCKGIDDVDVVASMFVRATDVKSGLVAV